MSKILFTLATILLPWVAIATPPAPPSQQPVVVFDFGGVMAEFDLAQMFDYCADTFGLSLDEFKQAMAQDVDHLAIGRIDETEFWDRVASSSNVPLPTNWELRYKAMIKELVHPRAEMYDLVRQLKERGYQVAMLSDVSQWQADAFDEMGLYDEFYPVLLSCNMGTRKPRAEAYELLLATLSIEPGECIFIDDRTGNIEAACAMGIKGILYTTFEDVKSAIEDYLIELDCSDL